MADSVTIGSAAALRSVRDAQQGVYEYLEEQKPDPKDPHHALALPVRLSGWLWRREGLGPFRRYRRRFCVFRAEQSALFVFASDDTVNGKLLKRLVVTRAVLSSRSERSFVVSGYQQDRELHKDSSAALAKGKETLPGDSQRFYRQEEEKVKAVSAKACNVWTHCFKHHMKSLMREQDEPDFVFEETKRRHSLPGRRGSTSALFASRNRSKAEETLQFDQDMSPQMRITSTYRPTGLLDEELAATAVSDASQEAKDNSQDNEELLKPEPEDSTAVDLPSVAAIWEDEELLSHYIDYETLVKQDLLASGATGEVWRALHRSQEVVVKNLKEEVMAAVQSPTASSSSQTTTMCRRRRAILNFVEEIRISSRLEHNRIVEFRGVAWSKEHDLLLVLEYLPRGDLRTFLSTVKRKEDTTPGGASSRNQFRSIWTWTKAQWRLAIDVIEGLVYLHSLNPPLVHGDLKSRNVLLRSDLRAKLADFGLSRYLSCGEGSDAGLDIQDGAESLDTPRSTRSADASASRYGSRARGTGRWMAPELLTSGAQSSMAADVYAFGIVLSEIDTCDLPFAERERLAARSPPTSRAGEGSSENGNARSLVSESALVRQIVTEGWKPSFRVTCPDAIKQLAFDCLLPDPDARPTSLAVAHRLRKAASKRERPEALAAQARATSSPLFR